MLLIAVSRRERPQQRRPWSVSEKKILSKKKKERSIQLFDELKKKPASDMHLFGESAEKAHKRKKEKALKLVTSTLAPEKGISA